MDYGSDVNVVLTGGDVIIGTTGVYRVEYSVRPDIQTSTSSMSASSAPAAVLYRNAVPVAGSQRLRALFNANVALVITLKVPIQGGAMNYTGFLSLVAGDVLEIGMIDPGGTSTTADATLVLQRVS
jgi:hypothetical protein